MFIMFLKRAFVVSSVIAIYTIGLTTSSFAQGRPPNAGNGGGGTNNGGGNGGGGGNNPPGPTITQVQLNDISEAFASPQQEAVGLLLGKALFWEQQIGSGNGGNMACSSCHYQGGADSHPARVRAGQFPIVRDGQVVIGRGSLGVTQADFVAISVTSNGDGTETADPVEQFANEGAYNVTNRNAPPAVDSDSLHNFWDGRANQVFNGVDITGDPTETLHTASGLGTVVIGGASQASQAVGPCLSPVEMSSVGRTFPEVGFKMLRAVPLVMQFGEIAYQLGDYHAPGGYAAMIQDAFSGGPLAPFVGSTPAAGVTARVSVDGGAVEQREVGLTDANFALFFGVSVALYERSLKTIPERLPSPRQIAAFEKMRCDKCHFNDGRSHAVFGDIGDRPFAVTGVAPLSEDAGVEVDDLQLASPLPNVLVEDLSVGSFKSSHLFNLPLTAPYFHDGSAETLEDMLNFYVRGGDFNLDNVNSHVRPLDDISEQDFQDVLEMMRGLTDPRIAEGSGPFGHPSLTIPLGDGSSLLLNPSDAGAGGLDYQIVQ